MASKMPQSNWRDEDDKDTKTTTKLECIGEPGIVPDHKIDETFMEKHHLDAAVRVTWQVNGQHQYSTIFAFAEILTFTKLKQVIADQKDVLQALPLLRNYPAVHIDRFRISYPKELVKSSDSCNDSSSRKFHRTSTHHSVALFDSLMRSTAARVSTSHSYCTCNEIAKCEMARSCPEVRIELSTLNENNERMYRQSIGSVQSVNPDKVVVFEEYELGRASSARLDSHKSTGWKIMINTGCLRRLLEESRPKS